MLLRYLKTFYVPTFFFICAPNIVPHACDHIRAGQRVNPIGQSRQQTVLAEFYSVIQIVVDLLFDAFCPLIHDMPRNPPATSTLRNRNRITNKTRLKIYQGSLDADAVLIPDEDEEKHLLTNLVAGVDADDANVGIVSTYPYATSTIILWLCDPRIVLQIC